jgi:hypothetical protein
MSYRNERGQPRKRVVVLLGDAQLAEDEKCSIARDEESLLGQTELLPIELSEEDRNWVRRILQLTRRSKSARPVCEQSVNGVVVNQVQSENLVQFDWARDHHEVIVVDGEGQMVADFRVEHTAAAWQQWKEKITAWLSERGGRNQLRSSRGSFAGKRNIDPSEPSNECQTLLGAQG